MGWPAQELSSVNEGTPKKWGGRGGCHHTHIIDTPNTRYD